MKIDAFSLDLRSERKFSAVQTVQSSTRFSFTDIMNSRGPQNMAGLFPAAGSGSGGLNSDFWVTPVIHEGQEAVSLTDRFMAELTAMRQIMADVMEQLRHRFSRFGAWHLTQVGQVYVMPVTMGMPTRPIEITREVRVTREESERIQVSAQGIVQTQDDREIDFSLDLSMARHLVSETTLTQTSTGFALIDPLVVQTDAAAPLLGAGQFSFDLDMDDTPETLACPGAGTGFLCLDVNQDGVINDGSEMFGPSTGNGFAELAEYDQDHNAWIDENDGIFDQLVLWGPGEEGAWP